MNHRLLSIFFFVVVPVGLLAVSIGSDAPVATRPYFAALGSPTMPFVPKQAFLSATWFCGGVPLTEGGEGGSVTVANPGDAPLAGHITVFTDAPGVAPVEADIEVPARGTHTSDLEELQPQGTYVSAMVEIAGGGGFVEQRAGHADGNAVSPCSNSTSSHWYFADNYTFGDSSEDLVITNPFPDPAILDITFAGADGSRQPQETQGLAVAGHSVTIVSEQYMPKDEAVLATDITASRGRVVVARAQRYLGERQGFSLTLGAPSPSPEWYFADGEAGPDVAFERYSIYNPNDHDVTVDATVLGVSADDFVPTRSDIVPAGRVVAFVMADFENLPEGRHFLEFSTQSADGVVVERGITRRAGEGFATSVVFGAPQVFLGYQRWSMAVGTDMAVDAVLVVANLDAVEGTVTVKALGPGGEVPVPGLESVVLPAAGVVAIGIPDEAAALGVPLIIESTQRIVVERALPRRPDLRGRSGSLALPG